MFLEYSYYMDEVECYHSEGFSFDYKINWVVSAITNSGDSNGYIVQHFKRVSRPKSQIIDDIEYFEAWRIKNGICLDRNGCDDEFKVSSGKEIGELRDVLHTKGCFEISATVYWIPEYSELFEVIDKWSMTTVEQTAGLKGSYSFNELSEDYLVFHRPVFEHSWSLITDEKIEDKIRKAIFRYCPQKSKRDEELMNETLDYIFEGQDEKLQKIKRRIIDAWFQRFE